MIRRLARRLRDGRRPSASDRLTALLPRIAFAPRADDAAYWSDLRDDVARATAEFTEEHWAALRLHDRVAVWLTAQDRRADLVTALVDRDRHGKSFATSLDPLMALPGYLEHLDTVLPEWLLEPHRLDLRLTSNLAVWPHGDAFMVTGSAYIRGISFVPGRDRIRLWAVTDAGRQELDVQPVTDPRIDAVSGDRWCTYRGAGIRALLDQPAQLDLEVTSGPVVRASRANTVGPHEQGVAVVESAALTGSELTVSGRLQRRIELDQLRVVSRRQTIVAGALDVVEGTFTARVDLPRAPDDYAIELVANDQSVHRLHAAQPIEETSTELVAAQLTDASEGLRLSVRSPIPISQRGRFAQRVLADEIWSRPSRLSDTIVATCFGGRTLGDNVEPVVREVLRRRPDLKVIWGVSHFGVRIPENDDAVLIHSRGWHEALHDSRLLINNANFPAYFQIAPGQTYLQTWHGTPLKRVGLDVPAEALSLSYRALMDHEAQAWSILLAQGPYAADHLPPAFGYSGEVLTTGYPRNDVLRGSGAAQRRQMLRDALGLRPGQLAVLYAPTWRDGAVTPDKRHELVAHLDAVRLHELLGDDVRVLLRGHSNTAQGRSAAGPYVIDVTDHPDISELYLAADVLVTDYSSVMFDFCVTGKPMLFLVPDLASYRDSTRGFYVDLEEIAPGPMVGSTEAIADELRDLDALVDRHAPAYAAFVDRFAPYDDGNATARVVDALVRRLDQ